jgi:hypothetical protein
MLSFKGGAVTPNVCVWMLMGVSWACEQLTPPLMTPPISNERIPALNDTTYDCPGTTLSFQIQLSHIWVMVRMQ